MEGNSIESQLEIFFSKSSLKDWKKTAIQETQGKDPFEMLSWRGKDGIFFLPYYDAEKDAELHFLRAFHLTHEENPEGQSWLSIPVIKVSDEETANAHALQHLMNGADGVSFDVRPLGDPDVNRLINKIEWPYCSIHFRASEKNSPLLHSLADFMQNNFPHASINGALFWESIPKKSNIDFFLKHSGAVRVLGHLIPETSPAAEISDALTKGVSTLERFSRDAELKEIFRLISFSLPANASFLECVSKFRALRILWFQIAQSYGQRDYRPGDLYIHALSGHIADGKFGPHENMLKGTFSAIAAVLGGCDALTIEGPDVGYISRWARNVSPILKEESFLDRIADPTAGAWCIDTMTDEIAREAWKLFQQKCTRHATP